MHHQIKNPEPTITAMPTQSQIVSLAPTYLPSDTPTATPTPTEEVTQTPTSIFTITPTSTVSPSIVITDIPTTTPTPTPTITKIPTETPTSIPTMTPSPTIEPTATPTTRPTDSPTLVPTTEPTNTPLPTSTPTITQEISLTPFPTLTLSPTPTATSAPTITTTLTLTPTVTPSPSITDTPTPTGTFEASLTPTVTITPTFTPTPTPSKIGNDISYPQCGLTYPTGQSFGIVGINGGLATTTNPCLSSELAWANISNDMILQPKVQLYVNTGNPGGLNTASWPKNNTDPLGTQANNPYGTCDGSNSLPCSWQYGWNRAVDDVNTKFIPAAQSAGISTDPANFPWWLDVETTNSWEAGSTFANQANAADLEGMVAYFQSKGISVGIYSTGYQWGQVVGTLNASSSLNGLKSWMPGASDLAGAQANCSEQALTTGSTVILTQFTLGNFDYDYSCL